MLSSMDDNFLDVLFSNANYDTPTSDNTVPPIYAAPAPDNNPPPIYAAPAPDDTPPPVYANPTPISDTEIIINHPIIDITLTQIL